MDNALLIQWGQKNEIGIPILDEQHRGIVSIINSFAFYIHNNNNTEFYMNYTFSMIDCYTKLHFSTEEEFMRSASYSDFTSHKKMHTDLIHESFSIANRSIRLYDPDAYLQFLKKWWMTHINECDCHYSPCVKSYLAL